MIKIAVCEDEEKELQQLYSSVQQIVKIYPEIQITITAFQSANSLLNAILEENYDIYLKWY